MSTLEALIVARLKADAALADMLTTWAESPAVFVDSVPDDDSPLWPSPDADTDLAQYARIIVAVEPQYDAARGTDGSVRVTITGPDDRLPAIERRVRQLLDGWLWADADDMGSPVATRWRRTVASPFVPDAAGIGEVLADFDLVRLPALDLPSPNPLEGLRYWIEHLSPALALEGDPAQWSDTSAVPALWWSVDEGPRHIRNMGRDVRWWEVAIRGHVITPDPSARLALAAMLAQRLAEANAVQLSDGSWLDITGRVEVNPGADPIRTGQVLFRAEYRTVAQRTAVPKVQGFRIGPVADDAPPGEAMEMEVPASG